MPSQALPYDLRHARTIRYDVNATALRRDCRPDELMKSLRADYEHNGAVLKSIDFKPE